jgi:hypothetical protein
MRKRLISNLRFIERRKLKTSSGEKIHPVLVSIVCICLFDDRLQIVESFYKLIKNQFCQKLVYDGFAKDCLLFKHYLNEVNYEIFCSLLSFLTQLGNRIFPRHKL